jgi:hypothetical protein
MGAAVAVGKRSRRALRWRRARASRAAGTSDILDDDLLAEQIMAFMISSISVT